MEQMTMYSMQSNNGEPSYKSLEEALRLVRQAVQGEREDELFYDYLISVAPTAEERGIIYEIRNDEIKHNQLFREIYAYYTGEELSLSSRTDLRQPEGYLESIRKALFGELGSMERYRNIRAGLPSDYHRDMVFEILTDELKHADKYNYILNLHSEDLSQVNTMQSNSSIRNENTRIEDTQDVTMDDLFQYITPLVDEAMLEAEAGADLKSLFQKYIVIGILIGYGFTIDQGFEQVRAWDGNL
jgi:rubrerythrin